ncbi:hypothetical protein Ancab_019736 [Ancistrocladus abbreviatus]
MVFLSLPNPKFPSPPLHLLLVILISTICLSCSTDYNSLVFKGCADQNFPDPSDTYTQNLKSLFTSLITQSTKSNFYKTTSGDPSTATAIFGLYQCRGDLGTADCYSCVSQFPKMAKKLCGNAIAVRLQLVGCYMRYEVSGFKQISSTELLYKYCKTSDEGGGSGFEEKRDAAFEEVEKGVVGAATGSGGGFYAASYESVYVLGQCEGDLNGDDCGECVRTALERVKVECGLAIAGQVYLHQCYIGYTYYPNGVGGGVSSSPSSGKPGPRTEKTVAIIVGVTAAVGFVLVILLFTRSVFKKKPNKHWG